MLRSILAVVLGFVVVFVLAIAADLVVVALIPSAFDARHHTNNPAVLALLLFNTTAFQVLGGYVTGHLARRRPRLHALILGALGLASAMPLAIAHWGEMPSWYHLGTWLLTLPATWLGGSLSTPAPTVAVQHKPSAA